MPVRHLVVTPLPNGRKGNTLFLSVHLSPAAAAEGHPGRLHRLRRLGCVRHGRPRRCSSSR